MVEAIERLQQASSLPEEALRRAIIPVEKIAAPLLLISSAVDRVWPSAGMADLIVESLRQHNHPFAYQHLCLQKAGHGVGIPFLPYLPIAPGDVATIANETIRAWQKVTQFLNC